MPGIGKTGATAAIAFFKPKPLLPPRPLEVDAAGNQIWRIVLETDALLHGPKDLCKYGEMDPGARLCAQYRDYFADAINQRAASGTVAAAQLSLRFYARQRWIGGYQARRFPILPDRYYSQLLTEAGSVFMLTAPSAAKPAIESFVRSGLPLPTSVAPEREFQYQRSAFPPENGYGEVSIADHYFSDDNP